MNNNVGGEPQIWFIPDIVEGDKSSIEIREANEKEIENMKSFSDNKLESLSEFMHNLLK